MAEDPEVESVQALRVAAAPEKADLAPNQEGGEDSDPELDQLLDRMYQCTVLIKAHPHHLPGFASVHTCSFLVPHLGGGNISVAAFSKEMWAYRQYPSGFIGTTPFFIK